MSTTLLRRLRWALWGMVLVMATTLAAYRWLPKNHEPPLPILQQVPEFSLTNRDGKLTQLENLIGKPWVADFVFTRCPGVCPIMTQRMQQLIADTPVGKARFVSISVDPEYDTPEILQAYAAKHGAGPDWYFLTGQESQIYPLIRKGFLLALDANPQLQGSQGSQEPIVHSNRFALVDDQGRIRGYYNSYNAEELTQLRLDLAKLYL